MGADVTHGRALEKKFEVINGFTIAEIFPIEGDYYGASYSSVRGAVEYAESLGVDPECWPIFYGFGDSEIDLAEVYERCNRLSQCISSLPMDVLSGHAFLKRVASWLALGEQFVITE